MKKITSLFILLFLMLSSYTFQKTEVKKIEAKKKVTSVVKKKEVVKTVKVTDFLKSVEGVEYKAYVDVDGYSIGCGHKILSTEKHLMTAKLTDKQVDILLLNDLKYCEKTIKENVKVVLNENQKVALKSFIFNNGTTAFKSSTLLKKINAKSPKHEIATEFHKWTMVKKNGKIVSSKGLETRRKKESNLFNS